jgi:hypothetical protein
VDRFLSKIKEATPSFKVTERLETPPGQRAQFDRSVYKRDSRLTGEGSVLRIPRLSDGLAAV